MAVETGKEDNIVHWGKMFQKLKHHGLAGVKLGAGRPAYWPEQTSPFTKLKSKVAEVAMRKEHDATVLAFSAWVPWGGLPLT